MLAGIRMSLRTVEGEGVRAEVRRDTNGRVSVIGIMTRFQGQKQKIRWISPNSIHRTTGFNGSGLPYHDSEQAFFNTSNKGLIESRDGSFHINMNELPSAYYTGLGSVYVPPVLMLETNILETAESYRTHIFLSPLGVPYRWIAGAPPGPRALPADDEIGRSMFYTGREKIGLFQNQEAQLRYKGYPTRQANEELPDYVDSLPWLNVPAPA